MIKIHDKTFKILIDQAKIETRISELANEISIDYKGKNPIFLAVLNGSFMFAAELFKNLKIEAEICFIKVQSYTKLKSNGTVKEVMGLTENIENREVIILEDIVDTGLTINQLLIILKTKKPKTIRISSLLFKPKSLKKNIEVDYIGFKIEPDFVVGFGLDYNGLGRNLADIYVLSE